MSTSITCDNCGTSIVSSEDETMWWIKVGWGENKLDDACSPACARALIDEMEGRQEEIEQAVDALEPSDA